jgi:hypothetical protein
MDYAYWLWADLGRLDGFPRGKDLLERRRRMRFYTVRVPKFISKILKGFLGIWQK